MFVIKRNGDRVKFNPLSIKPHCGHACDGLDNVDVDRLYNDVLNSVVTNMHTHQIQELIVKTALSYIEPINGANWTYVAGRALLYDLYHKVCRTYVVKSNGNPYDEITLEDYILKSIDGDVFNEFYNAYTTEDIINLNTIIDQKYDLQYTYNGIDILINSFFTNINGSPFELPQHLLMVTAMVLAQNEDNPYKWAKRYYLNGLSNLEIINASPILRNARLKGGSTASCLLSKVDDNRNDIFIKLKEASEGSALGAGYGQSFSNIRATGATVNGRKNASKGPMPFVKIFNDTMVAIDQGGARPGAMTVYLDIWHIDIIDWFDATKDIGDERLRARDVTYAVIIPDLFMERMLENKDFTLFDPYDVNGLVEAHNDDFNALYIKHEKEYNINPDHYNKNTKILPAMTLWKKIIERYYAKGMPFIMYKDAANRHHKRPELGSILNFNLCMEFMNPTNGVCNLGSLNLARIFKCTPTDRIKSQAEVLSVVDDNLSKLKDRVFDLTRMLDAIIDITEYPFENAEAIQKTRRAIGIGALGEGEMIANMQVVYGSDEHKEIIEVIYKNINKYANEATIALAKEKPTNNCYLNTRRNSYLMAVAPNSTSGLYAGTTNSHEPPYGKVWIEDNRYGNIKMTAPNINEYNYLYYQGVYDVDQTKVVELTAIRQKYIDMGISMSLHIKPEIVVEKTNVKPIKNKLKLFDRIYNTIYGLLFKVDKTAITNSVDDISDDIVHQKYPASVLHNLLVRAWELNLLTVYYVRTKPPISQGNNPAMKMSGGIGCVGCEAEVR